MPAVSSRAQTQAPPQFADQPRDQQQVYQQPFVAQPVVAQPIVEPQFVEHPPLQQPQPPFPQQVAPQQFLVTQQPPVTQQLSVAEQLVAAPTYDAAPSPNPVPAPQQLYPIATSDPAANTAPAATETPVEKSAPNVEINVPDFLTASYLKQSGDPGLRAKVEGKPAKDWTDMSADKWTVKLGGHVQLDYINWANASPNIVGANDYFEFRRLRLVADGAGYGLYDFRLQMTLEPETVGETNPPGTVMSPDVKDAYFSMNEIPLLGRWRIGNFFVPFGLEQVTNDTNNVFLERSIPTQGIFTADREVGMAIYNCTEDQSISWAYGAFFDSISEGLKERIDDNMGYRLSGRTSWVPYYDEPSKGRYLFYIGSGVLYTYDQNQSVRFRSRPQIHEGPRVIDSGALAADKYTTGNIESALVWGPVTLQGEAYISQVNYLNNTTAMINGNYLHLSYFLTGENRIFERFGQHGAQFGRNQPFSNVFFTPGFRSWGAWELKARWSRLDLEQVAGGQYNDFTFGFNWYLSDRTRWMFDWIHPLTPTGTPPFGAINADILALRFDFNW